MIVKAMEGNVTVRWVGGVFGCFLSTDFSIQAARLPSSCLLLLHFFISSFLQRGLLLGVLHDLLLHHETLEESANKQTVQKMQ